MKEYNEDDIVICTVKKIERTTVFVDIEEGGHGTIIMSEISAGRIRNLRDFVSIGKKIVCKILRISDGHIELSLRRVTGKEREQALDKNKKEKNFRSILKTITKDPEKKLKEIEKDFELIDFIEELYEDKKIADKYFSKEESDRLNKILEEKGSKVKKVKKIFKLFSNSESGLKEIKESLKSDDKEIQITYLGSSKFNIEAKANEYKLAEQKIKTVLEQIAKKAKAKHLIFEYKEK